jgi:hypothetical protein
MRPACTLPQFVCQRTSALVRAARERLGSARSEPIETKVSAGSRSLSVRLPERAMGSLGLHEAPSFDGNAPAIGAELVPVTRGYALRQLQEHNGHRDARQYEQAPCCRLICGSTRSQSRGPVFFCGT